MPTITTPDEVWWMGLLLLLTMSVPYDSANIMCTTELACPLEISDWFSNAHHVNTVRHDERIRNQSTTGTRIWPYVVAHYHRRRDKDTARDSARLNNRFARTDAIRSSQGDHVGGQRYNILTGKVEVRRMVPSHMDVPLITPRK